MISKSLNLWVMCLRDLFVYMSKGIIKLWIMKGARGVGVGGYTVILFVFRWSEMKFKWRRSYVKHVLTS
ncbi:hypothetical protein Hanom_Chr12g01124221 [Helianthus anomalus]